MPSMKILVVALAASSMSQATAFSNVAAVDGAPTVGKVVDFLGKLLSKSKEEAEKEREIYAKFKCYCEGEIKTASSDIKTISEDLAKMESEIEFLLSENGELSTSCAKLKQDIDDNEASQREATEIRNKASRAFKTEAIDLSKAIAQMEDAIEILSEVGGDQTRGSGEDHRRMMGGASLLSKGKTSPTLLSLHADVKRALKAAYALVPLESRSVVDSFLQAPITGSYTSQSGAVVGILKSMRATFKSNLESAIETEHRDAEAHDELMHNLSEMEQEMKKAYDERQEGLGQNDGELGSKKKQAKSAKESLDSAQATVDELKPMLKQKTEEFQARESMRANEEAAIAEAISILSSDKSLKAFSKKEADQEILGFLQVQIDRRITEKEVRLEAQQIVQRAAGKDWRLSRLAGLLRSSNPFSTIFKEIEKMVELIEKEQKTDEEKHAYCKKETGGGEAKLKEIRNAIEEVEGGIQQLEESVGKPETGLKAQEVALEQTLVDNMENQKKETAMRKEEKLQYQQNAKELRNADTVLTKAIRVLDKFYSSLDEEKPAEGGVASFFLQRKRAGRKPHVDYGGQSEAVTGENGAISMLEYILKENGHQLAFVEQEETEAQQYYEESMAKLLEGQKDMQKNMVSLKNALAQAEQEMITRKQDLKQAKKDEAATESLLADIKPGCDFIFDNMDLRTNNRNSEKEALLRARQLLKTSPAYQAANAEAEAELS